MRISLDHLNDIFLSKCLSPQSHCFRKRSSKPEAVIESLQWALSEEDLHILCIFKASPVYVLANTDACDIKALWHKYVKIMMC